MPTVTSTKPSVFVVTIRRSDISESEAYYMPAPTPAIAELRVRRLAKAPKAAVLSIQSESGL
jgi:uncharacterized protein (DUF1786 family)